jgi:hypothetical protein
LEVVVVVVVFVDAFVDVEVLRFYYVFCFLFLLPFNFTFFIKICWLLFLLFATILGGLPGGRIQRHCEVLEEGVAKDRRLEGAVPAFFNSARPKKDSFDQKMMTNNERHQHKQHQQNTTA